MTAKKVLIVAALVIFCTVLVARAEVMPQPFTSPISLSASPKITMADIDKALEKGPVFIEFETKECGYCKKQRPISEELAGEYSGKVTFFFVDASENRELSKIFTVGGVPQIDIIASKSGNTYTYVGEKGETSTSIGDSKFIGFTEKPVLKTALDAAVAL